MNLLTKAGSVAMLLAATIALGQAPAPADAEQQPGPPPPGPEQGRGPGQPDGFGQPPPPGRGQRMGPPQGMWWKNPDVIKKLNLTEDQQKKVADVFQQHRLKLIDARASVEREETILEPLMQADTPEDAKILAQIDKVAQARAELEKTNARMLLGIRHILSPDQWKQLQTEHHQPGPGRPDGPPQGRGADGRGPDGRGPGPGPGRPGRPIDR